MSWVLQKQPSDVFYKKDVLTNFSIFTGKHLCWNLFLNKLTSMQLFKKEIPTQVYFCEYYEIIKNTYFKEHLPTAAFGSQSSLHLTKI